MKVLTMNSLEYNYNHMVNLVRTSFNSCVQLTVWYQTIQCGTKPYSVVGPVINFDIVMLFPIGMIAGQSK